ncbi:MAG: antibiotic biosynthesis monooxygenase [Actinomycetota bacterium]|nr:antibiotic biosynthesis monooxygenase [Actinomycetota bacterium]
MLIIAGHLTLDPTDRDAHVESSAHAVRLARQAPGCLDIAVSADPVDPTRINLFERWAHPDDLEAFRNPDAGTDADPVDLRRIRRFAIARYTVAD